MKARLTDPKCMHLRWRKAILDNSFTRLKYIICSPLLSLINISWKITLTRITPHTRGQVRWHRENLNDRKCPSYTRGYKRKFSIIKGARTNLEGHEEKSKGSRVLSIKKRKKEKKTILWCSKPYEENKNKENKPKPNTKGHNRQFSKDSQMTKGQETSTSDP